MIDKNVKSPREGFPRNYKNNLKPERQSYEAKVERGWVRGLSAILRPAEDCKIPFIIAVGGGKGGVGKSTISANLSYWLQSFQRRVLLVDFDAGSSNLHSYLGLPTPQISLNEYLLEPDLPFSQLMIPTPFQGLSLISSGHLPPMKDLADTGNPERMRQFFDSLYQSHETDNIDCIVIDLGAGNHAMTMELFGLAHVGLVVLHAEPTSIENAYSFIKSHLWKVYENVILQSEFEADLAQFRQMFLKFKGNMQNLGSSGYLDLLKRLSQFYPELAAEIKDSLDDRKIGIIVNQARSFKDSEIGHTVEFVGQNYFGLHADYVAGLRCDDLAWQALKSRRLVSQYAPHGTLSKGLRTLTENIMAKFGDLKTWKNETEVRK